MIRNAKAKGTRNEHRTMRLLEAAGYACTRAAASLGVFDVIGISRTGLVLVQVKSNRTVSPAEREQMRLFPAPKNARKLVHVWIERLGEPRIEVVE